MQDPVFNFSGKFNVPNLPNPKLKDKMPGTFYLWPSFTAHPENQEIKDEPYTFWQPVLALQGKQNASSSEYEYFWTLHHYIFGPKGGIYQDWNFDGNPQGAEQNSGRILQINVPEHSIVNFSLDLIQKLKGKDSDYSVYKGSFQIKDYLGLELTSSYSVYMKLYTPANKGKYNLLLFPEIDSNYKPSSSDFLGYDYFPTSPLYFWDINIKTINNNNEIVSYNGNWNQSGAKYLNSQSIFANCSTNFQIKNQQRTGMVFYWPKENPEETTCATYLPLEAKNLGDCQNDLLSGNSCSPTCPLGFKLNNPLSCNNSVKAERPVVICSHCQI